METTLKSQFDISDEQYNALTEAQQVMLDKVTFNVPAVQVAKATKFVTSALKYIKAGLTQTLKGRDGVRKVYDEFDPFITEAESAKHSFRSVENGSWPEVFAEIKKHALDLCIRFAEAIAAEEITERGAGLSRDVEVTFADGQVLLSSDIAAKWFVAKDSDTKKPLRFMVETGAIAFAESVKQFTGQAFGDVVIAEGTEVNSYEAYVYAVSREVRKLLVAPFKVANPNSQRGKKSEDDNAEPTEAEPTEA